MANDERTPTGPPPIPAAVVRETTDRFAEDAIAAASALGLADKVSPEETLRRTLQTFVTQVRENGGGDGPPPKGIRRHPITFGLIKYAVTALFALGAAYAGIKLAVKSNADQINAVDTKVEAHDAMPAHDGAATKVEFKALDKKVQQVDKSVGKLGVKIDEKASAQKEQYDDIKDELKYLRRRRRRGD